MDARNQGMQQTSFVRMRRLAYFTWIPRTPGILNNYTQTCLVQAKKEEKGDDLLPRKLA